MISDNDAADIVSNLAASPHGSLQQLYNSNGSVEESEIGGFYYRGGIKRKSSFNQDVDLKSRSEIFANIASPHSLSLGGQKDVPQHVSSHQGLPPLPPLNETLNEGSSTLADHRLQLPSTQTSHDIYYHHSHHPSATQYPHASASRRWNYLLSTTSKHLEEENQQEQQQQQEHQPPRQHAPPLFNSPLVPTSSSVPQYSPSEHSAHTPGSSINATTGVAGASTHAGSHHHRATELPTKITLLHLVSLYFSHVNNQTYGFLHRPTFLRKIEEGGVSRGLLYVICAVAARFSPQFPCDPQYDAGEMFAVEARKLALRDFDKPTVMNVQMLLLLALHDFGARKGSKAWMFAGMSMRMAHALRLNREWENDPVGLNSRNGPSWTEREVRRRTFWACFVMDRLNSTGMERPHVLQEDDCLIQLPTDERSFMFEQPVITEQLIPSVALETQHNSALNMGSTACLVRIVALWGRVTKYVNQGGRLKDNVPPWAEKSGFKKLCKELEKWHDELQPWLKYSVENLAAHVAINHAASFVFMHVAYHTVFCTLHRFSVPSDMQQQLMERRNKNNMEPTLDSSDNLLAPPPIDFMQYSVKTCFKHAKAISSIMADVLARTDCIVTAPFLGFAMFTANLFHLHQVFHPCSYVDITQDEAQRYFQIGLTVLDNLHRYWGPLEALYKAIITLWRARATLHAQQLQQQQQQSQLAITANGASAKQPPENQLPITPQPVWRVSRPNSPGRDPSLEPIYDPTSLIPLHGGIFNFDFHEAALTDNSLGVTPVAPGSNFSNTLFADNPSSAASLLDVEDFSNASYWFDTSFFSLESQLSDAPIDLHLNPNSTSAPKAVGIPSFGNPPLSPFSSALHGLDYNPSFYNEPSPEEAASNHDDQPNESDTLEQVVKVESSVERPPSKERHTDADLLVYFQTRGANDIEEDDGAASITKDVDVPDRPSGEEPKVADQDTAVDDDRAQVVNDNKNGFDGGISGEIVTVIPQSPGPISAPPSPPHPLTSNNNKGKDEMYVEPLYPPKKDGTGTAIPIGRVSLHMFAQTLDTKFLN